MASFVAFLDFAAWVRSSRNEVCPSWFAMGVERRPIQSNGQARLIPASMASFDGFFDLLDCVGSPQAAAGSSSLAPSSATRSVQLLHSLPSTPRNGFGRRVSIETRGSARSAAFVLNDRVHQGDRMEPIDYAGVWRCLERNDSAEFVSISAAHGSSGPSSQNEMAKFRADAT